MDEGFAPEGFERSEEGGGEGGVGGGFGEDEEPGGGGGGVSDVGEVVRDEVGEEEGVCLWVGGEGGGEGVEESGVRVGVGAGVGAGGGEVGFKTREEVDEGLRG